jgi:hypothetical protein
VPARGPDRLDSPSVHVSDDPRHGPNFFTAFHGWDFALVNGTREEISRTMPLLSESQRRKTFIEI